MSATNATLQAYAGLHEASLAVALAPVRKGPGRLTLLVPDLSRDVFFAGVKTAAEATFLLARALDIPVRVVALNDSGADEVYADIRQYMSETFDFPLDRLTVQSRAGLIATGYSRDDLWIATYWTTAHALDVASTVGLVDPAHVIYMVQDYEAGFFGWSTNSALAESTYHAGFTMIVNSTPLRDYLARTEGVEVDRDLVFAPHFDLASLERAGAGRIPRTGPVRLFFYARPAKPRNMYALGLAALRLAVGELVARGVAVEVTAAGAEHDPVDLGNGVTMPSVGMLEWDAYIDLLKRTDVGLSLQKSAHPSHPPLELAMSGAFAVSNEFSGTRAALHPRLLVAPASVRGLADAVVAAVERALAEPQQSFVPTELAGLGGALEDVIARVAARLRG